MTDPAARNHQPALKTTTLHPAAIHPTALPLQARDGAFFDAHGRRVLLRGCNLGGDCKQPWREDNSLLSTERFYDWRDCSFVGRPLPLDQADEHLDRLAGWGFNTLRLLVTWEGLERLGPNQYDEAYYEYLEALVDKLARRNMLAFIDPHQDVWSRWTGGDGAPAWTLQLCGFNLGSLHDSGAAFAHEANGDPCPRMIWSANYNRLACATMFSLFFAGDRLAPSLRLDGMDAMSFLQGQYIKAVSRLASRLAPYPNVIGFDSLNEPGDGYIGWQDIRVLERAINKTGPMPSPLEAMAAGAGLAPQVGVYGISWGDQRRIATTVLGRPGVRAWLPDQDCIWQREGLWKELAGRAVAIKPDHFHSPDGQRLRFEADCLRPFVHRMARALVEAGGKQRFCLFVEGVPNGLHPTWEAQDRATQPDCQIAYAGHWYDGLTLMTKRFRSWLAYDAETGSIALGPWAVRRYYRRAIERIVQAGRRLMGGAPSLVGEFGLPFDLDGGAAFAGGDYGVHSRALARYYDALDAELASATIWNYTASNRHKGGDGWNGEDLSIWCLDEYRAGRNEGQDGLDRGGRALAGFVRPYPLAMAGERPRFRFDQRSGRLRFSLHPGTEHTAAASGASLLFLPRIQYPEGPVYHGRNCRLVLQPCSGGWILEILAEQPGQALSVWVGRMQPQRLQR